jgi:ubiquinone/menaquinone biosynthesis C-methylase UbiE
LAESLDVLYDRFYEKDSLQETIPDIKVRGWPRDRHQAVVTAGGRGQSVLDIGCGNGLLLYQCRDSFKKLVGLEYSSARRRQATANLHGLDFRPVCGSAENMAEIETGSIDQVVTADTIEHIPDVYAAAAEMRRVLRPGGD